MEGNCYQGGPAPRGRHRTVRPGKLLLRAAVEAPLREDHPSGDHRPQRRHALRYGDQVSGL